MYTKKLLLMSSFLAIVVGMVLVFGGLWAIYFTYKNVARENIVTPKDSSIPEASVVGPLTLMAQADIIREHTLRMTEGKTYAEMPRQIAKLDDQGAAVVDNEGRPVMIPNSARDIWITATTLTTALHLAILTYFFSGITLLLGCISVWTGFLFYSLSRE